MTQDRTLFSLHKVSLERDGKAILTDIDLSVNRGDFLAISGPNGGGKTSLLRIILGLLKPSTGSVDFCTPRPTIGYLPQKNAIDSQFPVTVREVVASGLLGVHGLSKQDKDRMTDEAISLIELTDLASQPIGKLSGGQLQRALFGRAIVSLPQLLVLDEPLSYIDKHFEQRIYEILQSMSKECTIVLVSHEMSQIATMANRHIYIDRTMTDI